MRLLPLMLLVVCCSASAEWVLMTSSGDGSIDVFIDPKSVKPNSSYPHIMRVWTLINLKEKGRYGERSLSAYEEHDCGEGRYRLLTHSLFSGSMGGGKIIKSDRNTSDWSFIRPDSLGDPIHKLLCS